MAGTISDPSGHGLVPVRTDSDPIGHGLVPVHTCSDPSGHGLVPVHTCSDPSGHGLVPVRTGLHVAAEHGKVDIVKTLLVSADTDINFQDENGCSALYQAVKFHQTEVVALLLSRGANTNTRNNHDLTPLHRACLDRQRHLVEMLVNYGADINATSAASGRPLHVTCLYKCLHILTLLLTRRADVNARDHVMRTPLHIVCLHHVTSDTCTTVPPGAGYGTTGLGLANILIQYGADIGLGDSKGRTALHISCSRALYDLTELLTEHTDCNIQDTDGQTCLHLACQIGTTEIVHHLLREGAANPNIQNKDGDTSLHVATQTNRKTVTDALLQYGCDVTIRNNKERTALHYACANHADLTILESLLVCGSDVNMTDIDGNTALHICCKYGHNDQLVTLVKHGADMNIRNKQGKVPVHVACQQGHQQALLTLLEQGADVTIGDWRGRTVLHQACAAGFVQVKLMQIILNHAPSLVTHVDTDGSTALHIACQASLFNDTAVLLLVKTSRDLGWDINVLDRKQRTPLASMLASCQSITTTMADSERVLQRRLLALDTLTDAGSVMDDISTSLMTSEVTSLHDFLVKAGSGSINTTSTLALPLVDYLCRNHRYSTLELMAQCGYRLNGQALAHVQQYHTSTTQYPYFNVPPCLLSQCRNVIRYTLKQRAGSLREHVQQLHLPPRLINYINFT